MPCPNPLLCVLRDDSSVLPSKACQVNREGIAIVSSAPYSTVCGGREHAVRRCRGGRRAMTASCTSEHAARSGQVLRGCPEAAAGR